MALRAPAPAFANTRVAHSHPLRRALVCRAAETTTAPAPAASVASTDSDEKLKTTISSLDLLLPQPVAAPAPPPTPREPAAAPTPAPRRPQPPPEQPAWQSFGGPEGQPSGKKTQQSFDQLMGFGGLAPEIINGRAAMIGFLAAISSELSTGESVYSQFVSGGLGEMMVVILAVTVASFAPAVRQLSWERVFGKDKQPAEFGPFTPMAEIINGRAAMLGIAVMLFFEGAGNSAFFL